jgi:hypothetical protein
MRPLIFEFYQRFLMWWEHVRYFEVRYSIISTLTQQYLALLCLLGTFEGFQDSNPQSCYVHSHVALSLNFFTCKTTHLITRLTPGVLLPPDHRHEFKILIPITLLYMTTITSSIWLYYVYWVLLKVSRTQTHRVVMFIPMWLSRWIF